VDFAVPQSLESGSTTKSKPSSRALIARPPFKRKKEFETPWLRVFRKQVYPLTWLLFLNNLEDPDISAWFIKCLFDFEKSFKALLQDKST
jgi:hypothetical protein